MRSCGPCVVTPSVGPQPMPSGKSGVSVDSGASNQEDQLDGGGQSKLR